LASCGGRLRLLYELAAGALASYVLGDSVLQFSTIIGTYLFAMGVGSWLSRYFERQLPAHFLRIELLVALIGGALPATLFLANAYAPGAFRFLLYGMVLVVGTLVGLEIPLVMRILKRNVALKDLVSQVLTFDYLGALAVSLAFPLLLVPQLGLIRTGLLFGLMNAPVALWALWLFRWELRRLRAHAAACVLVLGAAAGGLCGGRPHHHLAEDKFYQDRIVFTALPRPTSASWSPGQGGAPAVPQRQPAVCRARRIPLPRGPGAPGHGGARRAQKGGGAGRRRRHGGARDSQVPLGRIGHPGRAGPGHDAAVHASPMLARLNGGRCKTPRCTSSTPTPSSGCSRAIERRRAAPRRETFRRDRGGLPRPHQFLHRQALHQQLLCPAGPAPGRQRLRRGADHFAAGGAPELLDGGADHRIGGPAATPYHAMCPALANGALSSPAAGPWRLPEALPEGLRF
jgi:spermidine synthase